LAQHLFDKSYCVS